ncbi:MAG TPA: phosphate ABC transporter substrate-binding protein [Bacillota bacterium]|nr:phosphate ABC transporter substrate-binding protein [Bacillota bacterium]HQJ37869.1 phosphate ABC transporter substrate-binding protein [Bacillota bacterium]HQL35443.1 phosphate ABC transporter substrate-binding protein [Bacillota bacterium]
MRIRKILAFICAAVLLIGAFTGCAPAETKVPAGNKTEEDGVSGSITMNGSTSVQPLAEELAKVFKDKNPNTTIDIQGGGSGVGIKSAADGVVDIGMSSRDLKPEEKSLKEFKIAVDGIAVIVNPNNKVEDLSTEQIFKIYTGEITDWKEVGGDSGEITVVTREEGSGTRGAFIELTKIESKSEGDRTVASAITQGSTGAVIATIAGDPNAIGYASFGSAKESTGIKMISIDGKACTEENIYSGEYKISRPFLMLTKAEPTGLAKAFLDFILGEEGQTVISGHNYLKAVK